MSADSKETRTYVQQEQHPGKWQDHASTDDAQIALARYKAFATSNQRQTRLIERIERVLHEGAPPEAKSRRK
jgi:hypothetical protein